MSSTRAKSARISVIVSEKVAPPANKRIVRLVSIRDPAELSIDLQQGVNRIGRQRNGNHIVLVSPQVSRFHAEIEVSEGSVIVRDLSSSNGTFVNEQRVAAAAPVTATAGDVLRFSEEFSLKLAVFSESGHPETARLPQVSPTGDRLPSTSPPTPTRGLTIDSIPPSVERRHEQLLSWTGTANAHAPASRKRSTTLRLPVVASQTPSPPTGRGEATQKAAGTAPSTTQSAMQPVDVQRAQMSALLQASRRCMGAESLAALDRVLIDLLERAVRFQRGFVAYQLPGGDWKLVMSPKGDRWEREVVRELLQQSLAARAPVLVRHSANDARLGQPRLGAGDQRLLLPLRNGEEAIGTIFLIISPRTPVEEQTVEYLSLFSDIAALAIVNCARLHAGR